MRYEFHPEALAEYEAAALYYAERDPAVGQRFVAAVEDAIDRVLESPPDGVYWTRTSGVASPVYSHTACCTRLSRISFSLLPSCIAAARRM
jgi:plasmid stabilization system protein ParE